MTFEEYQEHEDELAYLEDQYVTAYGHWVQEAGAIASFLRLRGWTDAEAWECAAFELPMPKWEEL